LYPAGLVTQSSTLESVTQEAYTRGPISRASGTQDSEAGGEQHWHSWAKAIGGG